MESTLSEYLQNSLAAVACLAAAVYVSLRAWKVFAKKSTAGCGSSCGSCANSQGESGAKLKTLISLELPTDAKKEKMTLPKPS
jgi:hypothetical protein